MDKLGYSLFGLAAMGGIGYNYGPEIVDWTAATILDMETEDITKARKYATDAIEKSVKLRESDAGELLNGMADAYIKGGADGAFQYAYENNNAVFQTTNRAATIMILAGITTFSVGYFSASNMKFSDLL